MELLDQCGLLRLLFCQRLYLGKWCLLGRAGNTA